MLSSPWLVTLRNLGRRVGLNRLIGRWLTKGRCEDRFGPALQRAIGALDTVWDFRANVGLYKNRLVPGSQRVGPPGALGNRSILANPAVATMNDTINAKIKRRESFRPFAPSVLGEDVGTYFAQDVHSPFMVHVVKIRPEWCERLPAVTRVDGTGRLQTVDAGSNPLYHALTSAFKRRTGIGLALNTSFNENEPVVDTPEQAFDCFRGTDMDALCLGRYVLLKSAKTA